MSNICLIGCVRFLSKMMSLFWANFLMVNSQSVVLCGTHHQCRLSLHHTVNMQFGIEHIVSQRKKENTNVD
jgi:hypothetical protein